MTETAAAVDELVELDFDHRPLCEAELIVAVVTKFCVPLYRCRRKATWAGILPCCGYISYSCQRHYEQLVLESHCSMCDRTFGNDEIKWVKL